MSAVIDIDARIERMVVRYEAQHALRCLYLAVAVHNPVERYHREQNSLRSMRRELAAIAHMFQFDPATGEFNATNNAA